MNSKQKDKQREGKQETNINYQKWQKKWSDSGIFEADKSDKPKFFITTPYPYVNAKLHLGFGFTFTRSDTIARYKKLRGYNVLQPQGFHLTGEPIVGAAKKIERADESQKETLRKSGVPEEEIKKFSDPEYYAQYFVKEAKQDLKNYGSAIDWRRFFFTTNINKAYNEFVKWQFKTLKKKDLVAKGTHPIIWCPDCQSPTGDHDRVEGEGASPEKYMVYKFTTEYQGDEIVLPAATLRPETVYGVTNMWIMPDYNYIKATIDDKIYLLTERAYDKLKDQVTEKELEKIGKLRGEKVIKREAKNPVTGDKVPILPASFIDPESGTGVVMSVPSHAPYDYVAMEEAKESKDDEVRQLAQEIEPISVIDLDNYGPHPGIEISQERNITSLNQVEQLERATKEIYKNEFHQGDIRGKFLEGEEQKVIEAKEELFNKFKDKEYGFFMYEPSEYVECRCGSKCHVKVLENQWFLRYSDPEWKKQITNYVEQMGFYPEQAKKTLKTKLSEIRDKACARRSGLGTSLPWDEEWTIESLSDSTIYMSFYILAKYINQGELSHEQMNEQFFNYIFREKGSKEQVSSSTGLSEDKLAEIKQEFDYFYPVDIRNSGKDLLSNHLIFYLYHHVAIFDRENWPKEISANGFVLLDGEPMSKSKGNFITIERAIKRFKPDPTRIAALDTAEGLDNADFRTDYAEKVKNKLEAMVEFVEENYEKGVNREKNFSDRWIQSRVQTHLQKTVESFDDYKTRSALQHAFHGIWRDLNRYISQIEPNQAILKESIERMTIALAPFAPHTAEEMWNRIGKEFSVFEAGLEVNEDLINPEVEKGMKLRKKTSSDIQEIKEIIGKEPEKIRVVLAADWKYQLYDKIEKVGQSSPELKQKIMQENKFKKKGKDTIELIQGVKQDQKKLESYLDQEKEKKIIEESREQLEDNYQSEVKVELEGQVEHEKAKRAKPGKPAIIMET